MRTETVPCLLDAAENVLRVAAREDLTRDQLREALLVLLEAVKRSRDMESTLDEILDRPARGGES